MNRFSRQRSFGGLMTGRRSSVGVLMTGRRSSVGLLMTVAVLATLTGLAVLGVGPAPVRAQEQPPADAKPAEGSPPAEGAPGGLDESQSSVERRYQQFERTLLQMAEYLRKTEPERADLLIRAIGRSKEHRISQQMDAITQLLRKEQFGDAIGDQEHLVADLKGLLELLQSEDRRHQLEEEKKYYEQLHKEVSRLTARERELRRATERGGNLNHLGQRQGDIQKDAQSLLDKIDKRDSSRNTPDGKSNKNPNDKNAANGDKDGNGDKKSDADKKSDTDKKTDADKKSDTDKKTDTDKKKGDSKSDSKDGDKKSKGGDGKNADSKGDDKQDSSKKDEKSKDDKSQESKGDKSDSQKSESKKGDSKKSQKQQGKGQNSEGEQSEQSEQQEGTPSEDSESQDQKIPKKTPGRNELEAARRAMQKAEEELKRLQGKKGLQKEDEAIRKLAEARAQLEKVLRQLRQEEQEIILASLEARFAKMLVMQLQIHADTVALSKTPHNAWTVKHFGRARELSVEEDSIASEADKALTLLKEEGSSVAFPQGVEQIREDMQNIARRLSGNDVGDFTQSIERDVIESLEEMVTALQNEIEKRQKEDENRRQQRGQKSASEEEKELVQQLAELKMLRSLQFRVNRRTKQIGHMIKGEQANDDRLLRDLSRLARRQAEIQEATYIIATGRNR